jgi:hypothetical protein
MTLSVPTREYSSATLARRLAGLATAVALSSSLAGCSMWLGPDEPMPLVTESPDPVAAASDAPAPRVSPSSVPTFSVDYSTPWDAVCVLSEQEAEELFGVAVDEVRSRSSSSLGTGRDGSCRYEGTDVILEVFYLPFGESNTDLSSRWALYAYSHLERDVEMVDIEGVARAFVVDAELVVMRTEDAVFEIAVQRCAEVCAAHDPVFYGERVARAIAERAPQLVLP